MSQWGSLGRDGLGSHLFGDQMVAKQFYEHFKELCESHGITGVHLIMRTNDTMGCYGFGLNEMEIPTILQLYRNASFREIESWTFGEQNPRVVKRGDDN